jgi:outer membrane protein assembly factor BamB
VADGLVYVAAHDGHLYALDALSGGERWRYDGNLVFEATPAVSDGRLYLPTSDGLVALDAGSGSERWRFSGIAGDPLPPAVRDGVVYLGAANFPLFGASTGRVYALDAATGAERWHHDVVAAVDTPPVVTADALYIGVQQENLDNWDLTFADDERGSLLCLSLADGVERWQVSLPHLIHSSPSVAVGLVMFGGLDGQVHAVDATTGDFRWQAAIGGRVLGAPAIADGMVYAASDAGVLVGLGALTPPANPTAVTEMTGVSSDPGVGQEWPAFGGGIARSGSGTASAAGPAGLPELRWQVATSRGNPSSPAVVDDTVYIGVGDTGDEGGMLLALDANTGSERWRYPIDGYWWASPAVAGDTVYTSTQRGILAIDATTGQVRWTFDADTWIYSSPVVANGAVYVGADAAVIAVEVTTGRERWRHGVNGLIRATPAVAGGMVVVGDVEGALLGLDTAMGAERWRVPLGGAVLASPLVAGGLAVIGTGNTAFRACTECEPWGEVVAVDVATGAIRWRYATDAIVYASPASDGTMVVAASITGTVSAVDLATGREQWRTELGGVVGGSLVIAGEAVIVSQRQSGPGPGLILALDLATGMTSWHVEAGAGSNTSPAVADGSLYFVDANGMIFGFGEVSDARGSPVASPASR